MRYPVIDVRALISYQDCHMLGWTEQRRGWAARAIVLRRGCCALPRRHVSACLRGGEGLQAATRRDGNN